MPRLWCCAPELGPELWPLTVVPWLQSLLQSLAALGVGLFDRGVPFDFAAGAIVVEEVSFTFCGLSVELSLLIAGRRDLVSSLLLLCR